MLKVLYFMKRWFVCIILLSDYCEVILFAAMLASFHITYYERLFWRNDVRASVYELSYIGSSAMHALADKYLNTLAKNRTVRNSEAILECSS